jgi:hypothetical protein
MQCSKKRSWVVPGEQQYFYNGKFVVYECSADLSKRVDLPILPVFVRPTPLSAAMERTPTQQEFRVNLCPTKPPHIQRLQIICRVSVSPLRTVPCPLQPETPTRRHHDVARPPILLQLQHRVKTLCNHLTLKSHCQFFFGRHKKRTAALS